MFLRFQFLVFMKSSRKQSFVSCRQICSRS